MHLSRLIYNTVIVAGLILAGSRLASSNQADRTPAAARQQDPASAAANPQESSPAEPALALKLSWGSRRPFFNLVPGGLFASPPLLPTTRDSSGAPLSRMAEFVFAREGTGVRITVALRLSESNEPAKQIASYLAQENETVEIRELLQYGAEACQLTVVRFKPRGAELPSFSSAIASLQLVGINRENAPYPSYRVTVKNAGVKSVVGICTATNQETGCGSAQRSEGQTLIEPGAKYSWDLSSYASGQETPEGYVPDPISSVSVAGIVYNDDTYEGDVSFACAALAHRAAERILLPRVVKLLNQTLASEETAPTAENTELPSARTALAELKVSLLALKLDVGDAQLRAFIARYPALADEAQKRLPEYYRQSLTWLEDSLRQDMEEFERLPTSTDSRGRTIQWLTTTRDKYSSWLALLRSGSEPASK